VALIDEEENPVLAAAKPWHYWLAFLFVFAFVAALLGIAVGYVWKVVLVKYGFRTEKH